MFHNAFSELPSFFFAVIISRTTLQELNSKREYKELFIVMPTKLNIKMLVFLFAFLLIVMMVITLKPFNFFPENGVHWLSDGPGIYFDGYGTAFSKQYFEIEKTKEITIELLLKERSGSKNWGPKDIFSFYDGTSSPSLHIGEWGSRIFLYSRFEKKDESPWYKRFRIKKRFSRGQSHLVTATIGDAEKSLYLDGKMQIQKKMELKDRASLGFTGKILLGNSPTGNNGWWGEIKGIALYDRILQPPEVAEHYTTYVNYGFRELKNAENIALYTFEERMGNTVSSIVGNPHPIVIPDDKSTFLSALFHLPFNNMRTANQISTFSNDFVKNIFFFIPYGFLLTLILRIKTDSGFPFILLLVLLSGGLLSLFIEILQLYLPTRYASIADVVSNCIGSFVGGLPAILLWSKMKIFDNVHDDCH